jgi:hypothetical protein
MKILDLILRVMSVLLTLIRLVYDVHRDKKKAATDRTSDSNVATK